MGGWLIIELSFSCLRFDAALSLASVRPCTTWVDQVWIKTLTGRKVRCVRSEELNNNNYSMLVQVAFSIYRTQTAAVPRLVAPRTDDVQYVVAS